MNLDIPTLVAGASAFFAGIALLQTIWQSRRRAAFDHLRTVDERIQPLWAVDGGSVRKAILEYYRDGQGSLTDDARCYLALHNTLDLLALARESKAVAKKMVDAYMRGLLEGDTIDPQFIRDLQDVYGDATVYSNLLKWAAPIRAKQERKLLP